MLTTTGLLAQQVLVKSSIEKVSDNQIACITNEGYMAATSEKYLNDLVRFVVDKDYEAMQRLFEVGVAGTMRKGVKVYCEENQMFSGVVEFRTPGSTKTLWTVREGLSCNKEPSRSIL